MTLKPIAALLFTLMALSTSGAALALTPAPGETLVLTLINHSDHTLSYKGVSHASAGNLFTLTSNDILPGGSVTIRATSTRWSGIKGDLTFIDAKGNKNILQIRDPLQIGANRHPGSFVMSNPRLVSFVPSISLNNDTHPLSLAWTEATVEIETRLG